MTSVNLKELRRRLPYGSITRIADSVGVSPTVVSSIFNYGWYPQYHSKVIDAALHILDESIIDEDVIKHAEKHKLVTSHSIFVPKRQKKKHNPEPGWGEDYETDVEDLNEMEFEELEEIIEDLELDINLEDYQAGIFTSKEGREEKLRDSILDELYPDDEDDEVDENEDED